MPPDFSGSKKIKVIEYGESVSQDMNILNALRKIRGSLFKKALPRRFRRKEL